MTRTHRTPSPDISRRWPCSRRCGRSSTRLGPSTSEHARRRASAAPRRTGPLRDGRDLREAGSWQQAADPSAGDVGGYAISGGSEQQTRPVRRTARRSARRPDRPAVQPPWSRSSWRRSSPHSRRPPAAEAGGRRSWPACAGHAVAAGNPSRSSLTRRTLPQPLPRTMTTGHRECCAQCWLTDPSRVPAKPPCPRLPTTSSVAWAATSRST